MSELEPVSRDTRPGGWTAGQTREQFRGDCVAAVADPGEWVSAQGWGGRDGGDRAAVAAVFGFGGGFVGGAGVMGVFLVREGHIGWIVWRVVGDFCALPADEYSAGAADDYV